MEASHLSKCEMSFSNRILEIIYIKKKMRINIILNMRIIFKKGKKFLIGSKEESRRRSKEIFEWKPVIYRNVKCRHPAILQF